MPRTPGFTSACSCKKIWASLRRMTPWAVQQVQSSRPSREILTSKSPLPRCGLFYDSVSLLSNHPSGLLTLAFRNTQTAGETIFWARMTVCARRRKSDFASRHFLLMFYPVPFRFGFSRSGLYHRFTTFVPITCVTALQEYETTSTTLRPVDIPPVEGKVGRSPDDWSSESQENHGGCGARQELVHRVYKKLCSWKRFV